MKNSTMRNNKKQTYLVALIFWLIVWELTSRIIGQEILLVSPVSAFQRLFVLSLELDFWKTVLLSSAKISFGFFLGIVLGMILAIVSSLNRTVRILLEPIITTVQATPVVSFIILCLIWLSSKNLSIFISFLMVIPIIYRNVWSGIENIPTGLLEMATVFRVDKKRLVRIIYVSEVFPYFRSACNISCALAWKSGIAAEVIGIPKYSIGEQLYTSKVYLLTADLFAWTIVILLLSVIFKYLVLAIFDRLVIYLEGGNNGHHDS